MTHHEHDKPDQERLDELQDRIDEVRDDMKGMPGVEEGDPAYPLVDEDPKFVGTGEASDIDDQTIAPPG